MLFVAMLLRDQSLIVKIYFAQYFEYYEEVVIGSVMSSNLCADQKGTVLF